MTKPHSPSGSPPRKIDEMRALMAKAKDAEAAAWPNGAGPPARAAWAKALAFAAKFPALGRWKDAIERGHMGASRPDFCRAIGKDPEALIAEGITALKERYEERPRGA